LDTGVTAAGVGVVLNLAVWFGHKVIFPKRRIGLSRCCLLQKLHFPIPA
jgi:hypothetical protein